MNEIRRFKEDPNGNWFAISSRQIVGNDRILRDHCEIVRDLKPHDKLKEIDDMIRKWTKTEDTFQFFADFARKLIESARQESLSSMQEALIEVAEEVKKAIVESARAAILEAQNTNSRT